MSTMNISAYFKFLVILVTLSVLSFGFFCTGMFQKTHMQMSSMGMDLVSQQHQQPCCNLGGSHQIDSWRNVILVTPDRMRDALILLALALGLGLFVFKYHFSPLDAQKVRLWLYFKENPNLILFNNLKLAFTRGIINTKVY